MSTRAAAWLAWSIWAITIAIITPTLLFQSVNVGSDPLAINLLGALVLLAYATIGALIASRHPRNAIGWLLSSSALLSAFGNFALEYAVYGLLTRPGALPAAAWLGMFGGLARSEGFQLIVTFVLLLFPTGHLPSPRWRPLAWVTVAVMVLSGLSVLLGQNLSEADQRLASFANPLGVIPAAIADNLQGVSFLLFFACVIGCCAAVVARFRRARGVERQQLKWLAYAAWWAAVAFLGALIGAFANVAFLASAATFYLCLAGIPLAVGIAILRHRLFDIDFIINRTLVYGTLTVLLAALYFIGIVVTQRLTSAITGQSKPQPPVAVVITTLAIAALFQPLRHRLQNTIDRRFYRKKYDAEKTLATFSASLRQQVELNDLREHLLAAVDDAMQPAYVSLWLRQGEIQPVSRNSVALTPYPVQGNE
ncbi:MAG: hypothetical protein ACXWQZ_15075 [Ktedonobacterales bacterium]